MVRPALEFVVQELEALKQEGLFVNIRTLESPQGGVDCCRRAESAQLVLQQLPRLLQ
jgi:hypothetical protein